MPHHVGRTLYLTILGLFFTLLTNSWILAAVPQDSSLAQAVDLYYEGQFDRSLELLRDLVARDPEDRTARLNLIRLLREAGAMDEAILHLQHLLNDTPEDADLQLAFLSASYLSFKPDWVLSHAPSPNDLPTADYWRGLSLIDQGRSAEARQTLERLIALNGFHPAAYSALGEIALQLGDYASAEAFLQKALSQEPNLTTPLLPLAKASIALNKPRDAYRYLTRAKTATPWDTSISSLIEDLTQTNPDLLPSKTSPGRETHSTDFVVPTVGHWPSKGHHAEEVRIGLMEGTRQVLIKTGDRFRLMKGRWRKFSGTGQTILRIRRNGEAIEVYDSKNQLKVRSTAPLRLTYRNPRATTVLFDVEYGVGSFWSGKENRAYRGAIEFLPRENGMTVVNRLNMEEYLYAVVPSEVSAKWPRAVLEAQAIAARTYAYSNLGKNQDKGFDLYGSVASQAYNGIRSEQPSTTQAVDATQGLILTYNGRPISAFYSANSGGFSETSKTVWGMDLPYLKATPDPQLAFEKLPLNPASLADWLSQRPKTYSNHPDYSARSAYRWSLWLSRESIEGRLAEEKLGRIVSITTVGRSPSGRVTQVRFRGTEREVTLQGTVVRTKLGLRSTLFIIEPKLGPDGLPEVFLLSGAGWGHGVGMCQSGAAGMAASGHSSTEILSHYYPAAELTAKY